MAFNVGDNSALFLQVDARFDGEAVRRGATVTLKRAGWHLLTIRARDPAGNVNRAFKFIRIGAPAATSVPPVCRNP
jgi:hypothetical protein